MFINAIREVRERKDGEGIVLTFVTDQNNHVWNVIGRGNNGEYMIETMMICKEKENFVKCCATYFSTSGIIGIFNECRVKYSTSGWIITSDGWKKSTIPVM